MHGLSFMMRVRGRTGEGGLGMSQLQLAIYNCRVEAEQHHAGFLALGIKCGIKRKYRNHCKGFY